MNNENLLKALEIAHLLEASLQVYERGLLFSSGTHLYIVTKEFLEVGEINSIVAQGEFFLKRPPGNLDVALEILGEPLPRQSLIESFN